jgi:hemerythrin-like domain-containing protein
MHGLIAALDHVLAHHAFEENIVFPLIRIEGVPGAAELFADEHRAIEPTAKNLRMLAVAILRHGPGQGRWEEFRRVAQSLYSQMMDHLESEERVILQRLDRLLDSATDHRLALQHLTSRRSPAANGAAA